MGVEKEERGEFQCNELEIQTKLDSNRIKFDQKEFLQSQERKFSRN